MARTRAKRETSAGGVVMRREHGGFRFLLIQDSYKNWGLPKGHLERNEPPEQAALREVTEETGLAELSLRGEIGAIDWYFRFRGRLIHKTCHFYLMESASGATQPQREEGITECRWVSLGEALALITYANARGVLERAAAMVDGADVGS